MKRYFALFMCLPLLCISIFIAVAKADDSKTIKVGIYENQPKIFTDDKGKASGFWPDVIEYIASKEGWTIVYVHGTWTECLQRLEKNEIDIMPDVAFTAERSKTYAFSNEAVYTSWSRVYTQVKSNIYAIPDLGGKNIAVLKGSVNADGPDGIKQLVKAYNLNCTFTETDSYFKVFELVERGEADAGVTSKDFGYQHETNFKVIKTPIIFQPSLLYFAFPKTSSLTTYRIERIDNAIKALKQDNNSIYYNSMDKWLSIKPAEKPVLPEWIIWVLASIGGLALLLAGGSVILRSQVNNRTRALTAEIISRNRAEVELSTYQDHLENLVKERTAELELRNQEIFKLNADLETRIQERTAEIEAVNIALRKSEEKYRNIFDNAVVGIFRSTPQGRFEIANQAWAQMAGYPSPEAMMLDLKDIQRQLYVHPGDRDRFKALLNDPGIVINFETEINHKAGHAIWISISGRSVRDTNGEIMYYEGTVLDINERKKIEGELTNYRNHLESLVKDRTTQLAEKNEELTRANIRLQEMDSLKSVFLASMSHELRTPLNSIIGFTGVILQGMAGDINDEQRKQLTIVKSSANHLLSLISDVLDISKIEAGRVELSLEEFTLDDVMKDVIQPFSPMVKEKGLELVTEIPENVVLLSDRRRVKQIFMNMVSNAIKFTEHGSVTITTGVPEDGTLQVQVRDTGIGIKDEDMARLFEPFQQVDTFLTKRYEGTGLGLYLTRKLATLLAGDISAKSQFGKGSEFTFTMPLRKK